MDYVQIFFLVCYWLIFFRKAIINPYLFATGEMLSECFPNLILAGEYWSKGKLPQDPFWYQDDIIGVAMSSVCYPPHILISIISQFLPLNKTFILYSLSHLLHYLFMSIGGYLLFGGGALGLIGGLLFPYSAYSIKHYPPAVAVMAWIPWILLFKGSFLGYFGVAMAFLGGYLPLMLYFMYVLVIVSFKTAFFGTLLASPFLIRVVLYFKKSVLSEATSETKTYIGVVPKWKLLNFFLPLNFRHYINGVGLWEMSYYMSPVVLFSLFSHSAWWIVVIISFILMTNTHIFKLFGMFMHRIPARWGYIATIGLIFTTINGLSHFASFVQWCAVFCTALFLLENSNLITYYPFHQPSVKPEEAFKVYTRKFPTTQGQINHVVTKGYKGCFRKK